MAGLDGNRAGSVPRFQILLFGPQATRWTHQTLCHLQSKLQQEQKLTFVRETVADLPSLLPILDKLGSASSNDRVRKDLEEIQDFATGKETPDSETFSNAQLAALTVISHVVDLYEKSSGFDRLWHFQAAQGFCTGFLSAAALSLARSQEEFERYTSIAIRLAVCTGSIVDNEDASHEPAARATAVSVRWKTAVDRSLLETHLDLSPHNYVSCVTDDQTLTATIPQAEEASWRARLRELNISTSSIGLRGCYHHPKHHEAAQKLKQLSNGNRQLELPDAATLRLPLRSTADTSTIAAGLLHEIAIDLILCKKAHWFTTVRATKGNSPRCDVEFIAIGKESSIPRSLKVNSSRSKVDDLPPNQQREEIAVVGMACRFPQADSLEGFWNLLDSGSISIGTLPIERFDPAQIRREPKLETFWGNFLERPDALDHRFFGISGREAKSMDPQQRLVLQVAYEALESSGFCSQQPKRQETDVGCYVGVSCVDYKDNIGSENANAFSATSQLRAFISGRISHFFGWLGPSITFDTACSSSAVAIHTACRALLGGECSMALAGGVNIITSPDLHQNLATASFLSPTGASKAFDANADGYCRGEGAGLLVLKPLSRAVADGDHVFGVIAGSAVNQGSNCSSITVPDSVSQSALYQRALSLGHLKPSEVTYVEAHGTGTQVGDPIEYESVQKALSGPGRTDNLYLGSVKDNIGHCEAASGVAGVIKTLLMLQHQYIPKQANFAALNPKIKQLPADKIVIPKIKQRWAPQRRIALVNNYGAAGNNAAIVLRDHVQLDSERLSNAGSISAYPFVLSAKSVSSLLAYANVLKSYVTRSNVSLTDISYNLSRKQSPAFEYRASFVVADAKRLVDSLDDLASRADRIIRRTTTLPVVLAFGGQTGLCVTVSKQLYNNSELFRMHLDRCNVVCRNLGLSSIFPGIFSDEPVEDLVDLHCRLLSLQVASARSWIDTGLEVDTLVGHSFGQISALCIADSLSLEDAFRFVSGRARLIRDSWGLENGLMLSVECDHDTVATLLSQINSDGDAHVEVACYNGPKSIVLAGNTSSIAKAEKFARHPKTTRLKNSHAYHSRLADTIMADLGSLADSIKITQPRINVETCSPGNAWTEFTAEKLAQHTRQPVHFVDAVERIASRLPSATWLEAGSASSIIAMARRVLRNEDRSDVFLPVDLGDASANTNLAHAACQLWQGGAGAHFWLFHVTSKSKYQNLNLPPYQFEGTRHWIQYKPRSGSVEITGNPKADDFRERGLVSILKKDPSTGDSLFSVDTTNILFDLAVRGHAVTGQSLCPASMYTELAVTGALQLQGSFISANAISPYVEGLVMSAPLGLGGASKVFLRLHKAVVENSWSFSIYSQAYVGDIPQGKAVEHAKGLISLIFAGNIVAETRLQCLKKIARYPHADRILNAPSATGLSGSMVYRVFSDVVDYASYYRGVTGISSLGNEAVGSVAVAAERPFAMNSFVSDPISVDYFLQVAGIHVNCLNPRSKEEVYVCTTIEEVTYTESFMKNKLKSRKWTVYTRNGQSSKSDVVNDLFVYDASSRELVLAIMGATFRSVPFKSLARSLTNLNNTNKPAMSVPASDSGSDTTFDGDSSGKGTAISSPPTELDEKAVKTNNSVSSRQQTGSEVDNTFSRVRQMFSDIIEIPVEDIDPSSTPEYLGIDSLLVTEILSEIQTRFEVDISQAQIMECTNVAALCQLIRPDYSNDGDVQAVESSFTEPALQQKPRDIPINTIDKLETQAGIDLVTISCRAFNEAKASYDEYADHTKLSGYYANVFPIQSELVVKYIVDAFAQLGVDFEAIKAGDEVPIIPFHDRHTKLIPQLYYILSEARLMRKSEDGVFLRTSTALPRTYISILHSTMLEQFPQHASETELLATTGPKLAECLSGSADPIALIFKDAAARELLADVYTNAPVFKTAISLLTQYLSSVLRHSAGNGAIRILEIGGGTGGTTKQLVECIAGLDLKQKVSYTFTDLSSSLVAAARRRFADFPFMEYDIVDIEKEPGSKYTNSYDIVISTNCIHATQNLVHSTSNIRKMLRPSGILCLVEQTRNSFWLDLVFGLLEGWWLFNDGREHALAHELRWKQDLQAAGFQWVDWSDTQTAESDICRVITASPSNFGNNFAATSESLSFGDVEVPLQEIVTFKKVDGLDLEADIYYPSMAVDTGQSLPVG